MLLSVSFFLSYKVWSILLNFFQVQITLKFSINEHIHHINLFYDVVSCLGSGTGAGYREREKMQQGESLLPTRVTLSTEGVVLGPR
jgi:hypothetical protein